jgi:hypothetical protein
MTSPWEYRMETVTVPGKDDEGALRAATAVLDELGAQGWEAVGMSPSHATSHGLRVETTRFVVLLKRPIDA